MMTSILLVAVLATPANNLAESGCTPAISDCPGSSTGWWPGTAPDIQPRGRSASRQSATSRTRRVCGTWWVRGRDAHGHGGRRPGRRGTWHVVRECRRRPA